MNETRYEVITQQVGDEVIIPIPQPLLAELGWNENDTVELEKTEDGKFIIKRVSNA